MHPSFLYGTAWKEERTEPLAVLALQAGFTGFDTANQRKHYYEEGLGNALRATLAGGGRERLFLQTKFTYARGQDHRLPYDRAAGPADQVRQSFARSLSHLGVSYVDSYVLHGPETSDGLTANDWAVWRAMEELHDAGTARAIGASNMSAGQVEELAKGARIKPAYLQNRCYPTIGWDRGTRAVCRRLGIVYQGFNLLRDERVWKSPAVAAIAARHGRTTAQVVYRWALHVGMLPLSGTSAAGHMAEALASTQFDLTPAEVAAVEELG